MDPESSLDLPLTSRNHTTSFSDGIVLVRDYGAHLSGLRFWKGPRKFALITGAGTTEADTIRFTYNSETYWFELIS